MTSTVEQIKDRLNILDVVSTYVKLAKAGKDYKGISPFTKEKTPSFFVSPDRGVYYCFSTNKGGDMFTFVQEIEGVDFKGALNILAERAGIEVVYQKPGEKDARERLYAALEETTTFYEKALAKNPAVREYLARRGLTEKTIKEFRIGYALPPDEGGWRPLTAHLEKLGYTKAECIEAGLAKKGERGDLYDQFRNRIMFPLFDAASRPVAFSGRLFPDDPSKKSPKYLNSPETPLFHKSKFLYGYDRVRRFARKYNFSMLVEGQMDLVLSHQAGFTNTAAVSGTALTEEHLILLKRHSENILLAFDEDPAGIRAGLKSAGAALSLGMEVKIAAMPLGKDPADVVREDPALLKEAVKNALHVIPFALNAFEKSSRDERAFARAVHQDVVPLLAQVRNSIDRAQFVRMISERLRVREDAVWDTITAYIAKKEPSSSVEPSRTKHAPPVNPFCGIIAKIAAYRTAGEEEKANALTVSGREISSDEFWNSLAKECGEINLPAYQFKNELTAQTDEEMLRQLEIHILEKKSLELLRAIQNSERNNDTEQLHSFLGEQQSLAARLAKLRQNT